MIVCSGEMSHVFVDEMGRYFYQTLDGQSQQVVVVTEDPDQDSIKEVEEHTIHDTNHLSSTSLIDHSNVTTVITDSADGGVTATTTTDRLSGNNLVKLVEGDGNMLIGVKSGHASAAATNEEALRSFAGALSLEDGILQVIILCMTTWYNLVTNYWVLENILVLQVL